MKIKGRIIIAFLLFGYCAQSLAQWNIAQYGPNGFWLSPSSKFPLNVAWEVDRRVSGTEEWRSIGSINRPTSQAEVRARLMDLVGMGVQFQIPGDEEIASIWRRFSTTENADSLRNYLNNYPVMYALGFLFLDLNTPKGTFDYRFQAPSARDVKGEILLEAKTVAMPLNTSFVPVSATAVQNGVHVQYSIAKTGSMHHLKVFRSYYLRTEFQEIKVHPLFFKKDGKMMVSFNDESAAPKVPYSYYILPVDAAGNAGEISPEIALYNVPENSIAPSVNKLKTTSITDNKAIQLSWSLKDNRDVVSIEIFKSLLYDGRYFKVASLPPDDTSYIDYNVEPIVTYYYSVVLNGAYESSPASPRVAGMLQASNANYLPVQDLELIQNGNIIKLKWTKTERDTRGYYIYRGTGYDGALFQHKQILVSDSQELEFIDTLPTDAYPKIYAYSVADVNTSYAIGPQSPRVFAYGAGAAQLPSIDSISLHADDGHVMLVWENQQEKSIFISKHEVYRRTENSDGVLSDWIKLATLSSETNSFEDELSLKGLKYMYKVYNVSDDGQKSSSSPELMYDFIHSPLLPVSAIRAFQSGNQVVLNFQPPFDDQVTEIRIYRAEDGSEAKLYKKIAASATQFTDESVTKGKQYYYYIFTASDDNREGQNIEPVGVFIR